MRRLISLSVVALFFLSGEVFGSGPGTKLGDITLPTDPNAPLNDMQKKKKCICKIIDEAQTPSSRQKRIKKIDKNKKVFLPTWAEVTVHGTCGHRTGSTGQE